MNLITALHHCVNIFFFFCSRSRKNQWNLYQSNLSVSFDSPKTSSPLTVISKNELFIRVFRFFYFYFRYLSFFLPFSKFEYKCYIKLNCPFSDFGRFKTCLTSRVPIWGVHKQCAWWSFVWRSYNNINVGFNSGRLYRTVKFLNCYSLKYNQYSFQNVLR